ncbi:MAG TPA: carbohydrate kinase, partial [Bacteroidales bacterium]|nr:carbohydrate kinase [Bacteroidales bacterium]
LPGDYIAYRLSDKMGTTRSGLSEGILWDFKTNEVSIDLLSHFGIDKNLIPEIMGTFSIQGHLSAKMAE